MREHSNSIITSLHAKIRHIDSCANKMLNTGESDDAKIRENAAAIRDTAQEAATAIERFFSAEYSDTKQPLVDINETLREAVSAFFTQENSIVTNLSLKLSEPLPPVAGDKEQLRELLDTVFMFPESISQPQSKLKIFSRIETLDTVQCRDIPDAVPGKYVLIKVLHKKTETDQNTLVTGISETRLTRIHLIAHNHKGFIDISNRFEKWYQIKLFIPAEMPYEN